MSNGVRQSSLRLLLILALTARGVSLPAQAVTDAEVARGIRQVENGDHEQAILTLDRATQRLAAKGGAPGELAQAYLYLGLAYLAKGLETAAKVKFREAILQQRELSLRPETFAPKVIELFEVAREEVAKLPTPPAGTPGRDRRTETFSATVKNPLNQTGPVATTRSTSAQLSTTVTGQQYQLNVFYARCRTTTCPAVPFSLTVSLP